MQHRLCWLALSLVILMAPSPLLATETQAVSATVEAGGAALDIRDDKSRVNEYSTVRGDEGSTAYGKVDLRARGGLISLDAKAEAFSGDTQSYGFNVDMGRILKGSFDYQVFQHRLDHDKLQYLDAAIPPPVGPVGATVPLNPDSIPGFILPGTYDPVAHTVTVGGNAPGSQQIGRASLYGEDLVPGEEFSIKRREWRNQADLTIPQLPNLTFHAGLRQEERQGTEQSIGLSKCTSCHVTGESRNVDERTRDFNAGVTGRFGALTVDYAYADREFREQAAAPTRRYDPALSPGAGYTTGFGTFDNRILYDYDQPSLAALRYDDVPDSEKESHAVKARVDLQRNTTLLASFVTSEVKSSKTDEPGIFALDRTTLKTSYDGYAFRAATRLGKSLSLALRAKHETVDNDNPEITFYPNGTVATPNLGASIDPALPATISATRESVLSREVTTLGLDGVYRLARFSTLRLGYEFEDIDRDDQHYGTTKTHTVKATLKARPFDKVTARVGYTYQAIDNPLQNTDAAGYIDPVTGLPYSSQADPRIGTGVLYGTAFYDLRQTDLSNLPESIHEAKLASTWAPAANFSMTVSYRARLEENSLDRSDWQQETHSPGISAWYAPDQKLNLTFAYNYLGQRTEAKFCQGWYDG